ncbi:2OG-Fe(II) oxygenase [Pseudomonas entomophila]|nr:2OG-Fe(II) oxygenase [Pseudomonas entomophila]
MKREFTSEDVRVLENAITPKEQVKLDEAFACALWRYDWPVSSTPFARPCWHFFIAGSKRESLACCEEELEANERWRFLLGIWRRLCAVHMNNVRLIGVYANGQSFGQDSPIHRDNLPSEPGQTAVLFCNGYWATTWGGELVFCNDAKTDVSAAVLPKPGRIAIFNGEMPHRAKSPTIECDRLRITIAFKTVCKDLRHE